MNKFFTILFIIVFTSISFAFTSDTTTSSGGPFACACELVDDLSGNYTQMVVLDLSNGKIFKFGKFTGSSAWRVFSNGQASVLCTKAISIQSICKNGKIQD